MSEYQYYEFAAIDRPLTRAEMTQLRGVSTRAAITPAGFVNHYEWGDLKADPTDWMQRFFDAFVYTANWCSCRLALRLPLATFRKAELKPFRTRHALTIEASREHWIIDWSLDDSENHDRFGMEDGSGWMRRLVPLRDELLRGDLRPLYLGWLAAAGGLGDDALEPAAPPGLSALSPPQQALVEFIEIDPDMLAAAACSARASEADSAQAARVDSWLSECSRDEMAFVLKLIAQGQARSRAQGQGSSCSLAEVAATPSPSSSAPLRSLGQLRELARLASRVRVEREAEERETALRLLMADADKHWAAIDTLAQRGSASSYEQAVHALAELAEGYTLASKRKEFDRALQRLLVRHATRSALQRRLAVAGLWSE